MNVEIGRYLWRRFSFSVMGKLMNVVTVQLAIKIVKEKTRQVHVDVHLT